MAGSVASYFVGVKGGLVMSLIAFSIVFIVIIGLMFVMICIKYFAAVIERKDGGNGSKVVAVDPKVPAPVKMAATASDNGELLAVITAAITATSGSSARVVAFSPVVKAPVATGWKLVARMRNAEGFQD